MSMRVLWTEPRRNRDDVVMRLEAAGCQVVLGKDYLDQSAAIPEDELRRLADGVDALLVGSRERFPAGVLEASPNLQVVAKCGIGVDRIDREAAARLGVLITNTPLPEDFRAVAEGTLARILGLAKNLQFNDRAVRDGSWTRRTNLFLSGKTVGLVGFGRIGQLVATYARALNCKVIFTDPYLSDHGRSTAEVLGARGVSFDELLAHADVVSLHAVASTENCHLIDADALAEMRTSAFLVNTARGSLIDETALAAALQAGEIAGAALDVFESEPLAPDSPLLEPQLLDRLLLSPHTAARTPEGQHHMPLAMVDNALAALRGEVPEYVVNPEAIPAWRQRFHGGTTW